MSDQNSNAFTGIEKLDEFTRDEIITDAQRQVDRVNADTRHRIAQAKEQECSARIAEELATIGKVTHEQRVKTINKWHRRFGLYDYGKGGE